MYPTCNLACHYLLSPLSECQRLLIEMKGVEFLLLRWGCLPAFGIDKWLTGERFLKVISSYRQDLRKAQSPVTEQILVPIYYTCHFHWKDILTQVFYLFSRVQGNFERTRWILAVHQKDSEREERKEKSRGTSTFKSTYSDAKASCFLLLLWKSSNSHFISTEGSII